VVVGPDGRATTGGISTALGCFGPELVDATMEQADGTCGDGDRATLTFEDERVNVSGTHRTPTPCHDLTLSSVELRDDEETGDDTLLVTVGVATRQRECPDCVGTVPYEVTVDLKNDYPSSVRVTHTGPTGERVASRTWQWESGGRVSDGDER